MSVTAPERPLDERIARAAFTWTLEPVGPADEIVDRVIGMASGNRTAVARALGRVSGGGRTAEVLRLALARGHWAW